MQIAIILFNCLKNGIFEIITFLKSLLEQFLQTLVWSEFMESRLLVPVKI